MHMFLVAYMYVILPACKCMACELCAQVCRRYVIYALVAVSVEAVLRVEVWRGITV